MSKITTERFPVGASPKKVFGKYKKPLVEASNLVEVQLKSFDWFLKHGLKEVFDEFKTIKDFTGKKFELQFLSFELAEPKTDEYYAKDKKGSFETSLKPK